MCCGGAELSVGTVLISLLLLWFRY